MPAGHQLTQKYTMGIFDFFKKNNDSGRLDAKGLRDAVLQFIKEELQQLDGGEGNLLSGLSIFVNPEEEVRFIYEAALYRGHPEKIRDEIQRIADNFALNLPEGWKLAVEYVDELPEGCIQRENIRTGLKLQMASVTAAAAPLAKNATVRILKGTAEQDQYPLKTGLKRLNIGRGRQVQAGDGSFRTNHVSFPDDPAYEANKYISRQHAHIEWDEQALAFKLYADEGGVPPGNKTKIKSAADESVHKLNSTQVGYTLKDADQIILGDVAILEFSLN